MYLALFNSAPWLAKGCSLFLFITHLYPHTGARGASSASDAACASTHTKSTCASPGQTEEDRVKLRRREEKEGGRRRREKKEEGGRGRKREGWQAKREEALSRRCCRVFSRPVRHLNEFIRRRLRTQRMVSIGPARERLLLCCCESLARTLGDAQAGVYVHRVKKIKGRGDHLIHGHHLLQRCYAASIAGSHMQNVAEV